MPAAVDVRSGFCHFSFYYLLVILSEKGGERHSTFEINFWEFSVRNIVPNACLWFSTTVKSTHF